MRRKKVMEGKAKRPNRDSIKAELRSYKYAYKESENLTRLGEMVQCARRGLMSYEKRYAANLSRVSGKIE